MSKLWRCEWTANVPHAVEVVVAHSRSAARYQAARLLVDLGLEPDLVTAFGRVRVTRLPDEAGE